MPQLNDPRQDLYCQHRARGMIPSKAAVAAGYAVGSGVVTKLEEAPEINARISELMEEISLRRDQQRAAAIASAKKVGEHTGLSRAWIIQQLVENAVLARQDGAYKESNDALKMIGDEYGMFEGGSALDDLERTDGQRVLDLDTTNAVLDKAREMLSKPITVPNEADVASALSLIQGNKPTPITGKDRELSTGSETDISMMPESDPETFNPDPNQGRGDE